MMLFDRIYDVIRPYLWCYSTVFMMLFDQH